ncbi:hypothetical protein PMJEKBHI_02704 [Lacticaseibacillus rhamnosus]|uniref:Uncharacterized protein n=1 Tax=Lacticaseibacillus rhamnosus (strain LMS2-1) TaxID=525361 RepID=C2JYM5_LACRM|nr:conserved hypothetical protein [Lacticaseibacillus rhamnosus ATCC 8530]EEN79831.1 hypothetical protein HMPREF0539_2010 [Lacticaseibacillus rhamnosus LMS2-1]PTR95440.1 hypothetical protein DBP95_12140 [Lacticaseibacillus rhamnosus]CAR91282.1 Putative protein without homology [Lacticaseibacillus rhamnosus Lc 705]PTS03618.1 hypothetical protein DBQ08_11330 [Lacticaseibacillus rhamnosus]
MAKDRPLQLRPLTLRFLTGLARAHSKNSIHPCFAKGRMLQRGTTQIYITFTSNASTTPKFMIFRGPES